MGSSGSGDRGRSGRERQARRRDFGSRRIAGVYRLGRRTRVLAIFGCLAKAKARHAGTRRVYGRGAERRAEKSRRSWVLVWLGEIAIALWRLETWTRPTTGVSFPLLPPRRDGLRAWTLDWPRDRLARTVTGLQAARGIELKQGQCCLGF